MTTLWEAYCGNLCDAMKGLAVTDGSGRGMDRETGLAQWSQAAFRVRSARGTIFFAGNGASASMACHLAADAAKNGRVRTQVFTDAALLTAVANDISYDQVFAEPLRWYMRPGDLLVAVSSSGNSPNVVKAVDAARDAGGVSVTLSAMAADNAIRRRGDLNFYVPAVTYGMAESAHAALLHYWMDQLERSLRER